MIYDIAFLIFSLFYLPALVFRGKFHGDFAERFARYSPEKRARLASAPGAIWIQAVSVGEVGLCRGLMPLLKGAFPGRPIVISTITKTGNDLAQKLFGDAATVIYFPLDLSWIASRAISLIQPAIYVMVETEIWPNVIRQLSRQGTPSVMINGRISDRSFGRYMLARPFLAGILARVSRFAMQSELDAGRIINMGAPRERVAVTGTMKFDVDAKADAIPAGRMADKIGLGPDDRLLVAGSTHPGEEEAVIASFKELSGDFPELKLLIAPRHVDRVPEIENVVRQYHLTPVRVSSIDEHDATQYAIRNTLNHSLRSGSGRAHDPEPLAASRLGRCPAPNGAGFRASAGRVYLLDTIGSLTAAYSLASVVVIGGSFVMHGGQNPIEPAALGKPVIFGPYMFNFKEPSRLLVEGRAAIQISYPRYITGEVRRLLKNAAAAVALGDNARRVVAANRGATERDIGIIGDALGNGAKG